MAELKFEIVKEFGCCLSPPLRLDQGIESGELERPCPQIRHREWAPDHTKNGQGRDHFPDEIILLRDLLNEIDL